MDANIAIVVGLLLAPVVLLTVLRASATLVFLGLCLGYVVMQFLGADARSFAAMFLGHEAVSANLLQLALLLIPPLLTMVFMARTVRGTRLLVNLIPAAAAGCLMVLLVVPLLSPGLSHAIMDMPLWHQAVRLQGLVIGTGALISLLFLWMLRPGRAGEKHGK